MTVKQLYVATPVQIALLREVLIPEMCNGYWKDHRPAGHGKQWNDVEILITTNEQVGPNNFKVPRNYNFVNPEFIEQASERLVEVAKAVDPKMTIKLVKRQLTELSQIVGGRKTDTTVSATKAYRGHNVIDDTPETSVLVSGKGLGSEKWIGLANGVIDVLKNIGATIKETRTMVEFSRGSNEARMSINGAGEFVIQDYNGFKVIGVDDPDDGDRVKQYVQVYMLSVNNRKQNTQKSSSASVTELPNGSIIRRVPVTRATLSEKTKFETNPFNL